MSAPTDLTRFPIKKLPITTTVPLPLVIHDLLGFFCLYIIFDWGRKFLNFLSHNSQKSKVDFTENHKHASHNYPFLLVDESLCRDEVEKIMAKLGIFCNPEDEKLHEKFDWDNFHELFEEEEEDEDEEKYDNNYYNNIIMQELGEAFDVFDENRDGFIDEMELQRVLFALGFKEAAQLENCKKMILAFDLNGDGKIDFGEFVEMI